MEAAAEEKEVQAEANADNDDNDGASHLLLCGLMTLPKLRLSLPAPLPLSFSHTHASTHTVSRCCCSPAKLRRRRRRRAMWSCLNLILCALHTPLPRAVPALPLPHCPRLSHSTSSLILPRRISFIGCGQFIFLNYFEKCFENCVKCTRERQREKQRPKRTLHVSHYDEICACLSTPHSPSLSYCVGVDVPNLFKCRLLCIKSS